MPTPAPLLMGSQAQPAEQPLAEFGLHRTGAGTAAVAVAVTVVVTVAVTEEVDVTDWILVTVAVAALEAKLSRGLQNQQGDQVLTLQPSGGHWKWILR